jgi:hypothetical protein
VCACNKEKKQTFFLGFFSSPARVLCVCAIKKAVVNWGTSLFVLAETGKKGWNRNREFIKPKEGAKIKKEN